LQLARCPFWGWRSGLPLLVLLLAGGAFALATSSAGRADDPPPTTVSTPTVPAPVPEPAPPPARVQPPRKLPTPKTSARRRPRAATPAPPVASTPAQSTRSVVSHPAQVRPKEAEIRAHKVHRKAPARHPRKAPAVKLTPQATLGASVSYRNQAGPKSTSSFDVSSLVLILGLAIATACFSFALIPARALPWRHVASFRSERQVDMTLIGLALLATTFMLYLMTRA
jgi:cobalamin biosynthesis Mg chelatase CobN